MIISLDIGIVTVFIIQISDVVVTNIAITVVYYIRIGAVAIAAKEITIIYVVRVISVAVQVNIDRMASKITHSLYIVEVQPNYELAYYSENYAVTSSRIIPMYAIIMYMVACNLLKEVSTDV